MHVKEHDERHKRKKRKNKEPGLKLVRIRITISSRAGRVLMNVIAP